MKIHLLTKSIIIGLAILMSGCDKVEKPYIEGNPFTGVYDSDLPVRKILLEDFTGFGCINCPDANEEIHKLQERYGAHIIPIAIHSGWFATPILSSDPDYRTATGSELGGNGNDSLGFFNITSQPIGVINRTTVNEEYLIEYEDWSARIVELLTASKFAEINIEIESSYDSDTREANINIKATAINNIEENLHLSVYIIENHIIGKQKDGSEVIEDYEHNHMLRAGVNGAWGESVTTSALEAGAEIEESFSYILNENWNETNCEIVAFIYNSNNKEIVQAEISPVIE